MNKFVHVESETLFSRTGRTLERFANWIHQSFFASLLVFLVVMALIVIGVWTGLDFMNPNGSRKQGQTSTPREAPADRRYREQLDASFKACIAAGGVPIMASPWAGGEMNDCKFPPKGGK